MPKMDEFAKLAQAGAAALNPVNAAEAGQVLVRWSEPALRRLEADSEGAARAAKLRAWVGTVARRRFIREGEAREVSVGEAGLPPWAKEALGAGRSAHRLLFSDQERVLFERVADYLAADTGPSAAADWSRISWSQAVEAERRWIEALAEKAAAKDAEAKAAEGAIRVGDEGPDGSRWVRLDTAEALDREGALMRHCVGSYAKSVATKGTRIYSLRDGANKPRLTVELRAGGLDPASLTLAQARGFANEAPKPEDKKELGKLLEAVKAEEGFSVDRFSADAQRLGIGHFRFREASGGSFAATMGLDAEEDEKALERALAEEELCRKNPGLRDFGNLAQIVSCAFASGLPDLAKRADGLLASQSDPRAVGKFYEAYFEFERRRYDAQLAHPGQAEFLAERLKGARMDPKARENASFDVLISAFDRGASGEAGVEALLDSFGGIPKQQAALSVLESRIRREKAHGRSAEALMEAYEIGKDPDLAALSMAFNLLDRKEGDAEGGGPIREALAEKMLGAVLSKMGKAAGLPEGSPKSAERLRRGAVGAEGARRAALEALEELRGYPHTASSFAAAVAGMDKREDAERLASRLDYPLVAKDAPNHALWHLRMGSEVLFEMSIKKVEDLAAFGVLFEEAKMRPEAPFFADKAVERAAELGARAEFFEELRPRGDEPEALASMKLRMFEKGVELAARACAGKRKGPKGL